MKQYHRVLRTILAEGTWQANRTGTDALSIPGDMMKFDLRDGFPAVTTKKLAFEACAGELVGHLQGKTSAADFRALGCNIWDADANENESWLQNRWRGGTDDLGWIYGFQWRHWGIEDIDQVLEALFLIRHSPTSRRIIITGWNPDDLNKMALPPCHLLYQFIVNVEKNELNLCMYQRSCDMFLGVPFNIAMSAMMLSLFARMTGYTPRFFTHFLADAHIYRNHMDQVQLQLSRDPLPLPKLAPIQIPVSTRNDWEWIENLKPSDFALIGYNSHPAIKGVMATTRK